MDIPQNVANAVARKPKTHTRRSNAAQYKIEKTDIAPRPTFQISAQALPSKRTKRPYNGIYPFDLLPPPPEPGKFYSFFVPAPKGATLRKHANAVGQSLQYYRKNFALDKKFRVHECVEHGVPGVRVYRKQ